MKLGIQITFKTVQHIDHIGEARCFERVACVYRALTAAAQQPHSFVFVAHFVFNGGTKISCIGR